MTDTIYTRPEHVELRRQVARFLAQEVEPNALAWDEQGYTPRDVLRTMGALGWLGLTAPAEYGGAEADVDDQRRVPGGAVAFDLRAASSSRCWSTPTWRARTC